MVTAAAPSAILDRLSRRFQGVQLRFAALNGQARELFNQQSKLTKSIALAKARLELAPQAAEVFTYLQEKAHRRAVGEFEDLLSALVDDVIPDAGTIQLKLGTYAGSPALDILVDNGGDLEDVLKGQGGGLTNVVVVGLGYAALSRTRNRQLMVLDEPDCWLKAVNVPAFTKVIAEVANPRLAADGTIRPGCQTLMVTHNDIGLMDEGAHIQDLRIEHDLEEFAARHGVDVVHVGEPCPCAYVYWVSGSARGAAHIEVRYRDDGAGDDEKNALTKGFPYLESIGGARPWDSSEQTGIRWIEVFNLRTHVYTHMDLSSGLNVLTGGVNCGKSNLYFTAMRAMAYGDSDDGMIRHGARETIIRMGVEKGLVLEMVRQRKGTPKVTYRVFQEGNPVALHDGPQEHQGTAPSFITDILKINRVDKLDIQLRSQKQPIFLLTETAERRAQVLSVGRESSLLQDLIERQRLQVRRDRENNKREELELASINRTLLVMEPLAGLAPLVDIMSGLFEDAVKLAGAEAQTRATIAKLAPLEGQAKLHDLCIEQLSAPPVPVALQEKATSVARELVLTRATVSTLAPLQDRARVYDAYAEKLATTLTTPALHSVSPLLALIERLEKNESAASLKDLPLLPVTPVLANTAPLERVIERLALTQHAAQLSDLPSVPVLPVLSETASLAKVIKILASGYGADLILANLPEIPKIGLIVDTKGLRQLGVELSTSAAAIAAAEADEAAVVAEISTAEKALHEYKHELGICPTCNQQFDEAI